ncbi:6468_t:CDS:2 [Funneliformis mosseae]|uniref:6468_t:CDS:1 n=1 Tax=Funneliformis mosseae TaxID=27381 RepID=A0A9N9C6C0_FUNMO|nr:6468_t:CDS:2 [Funneliformis mosseae]
MPSEITSGIIQEDIHKYNATKWIENALKVGKVNSISFKELKKPKSLNTGNFGCIMKAIWTKTNNYVVYKKLTNTEAIRGDVLEAFIHELQIHLRLDYSERIVRCLGISQGNGTRETTIPGTPKDYELIYKRCWRQEPKQRPTIEEVLDDFAKMNFGTDKSPSVKDVYVEFDPEIANDHNNQTSESQFINFLENH